MNWHYVEQGKEIGPVSDEQFEELVRTGKIQPDTFVWRDGMVDSAPYSQAKGSTGPSAGNPAPETVCSECGRPVPANETIRFGDSRICAACKPIFMRKLAADAPLAEGAHVETWELNYAPVIMRFAAVMLDGLIVGAVSMAIGSIAILTAKDLVQSHSGQYAILALRLVISMAYEVILIAKDGATLGKMVLRIKVVTADGGPISYPRSFARYLAKILSGFLCLIGYIIAFFDNPQNRALHDHICNTRVIYRQ